MIRILNPSTGGTPFNPKPTGWTQLLPDTTPLVNQLPATGDAATILFKRMMNAAGYTTDRSSDGTTTFSNSGDVIGTSAAALAHTAAYFSLNSPDGKRSFMVIRGTNSRLFEFAVSTSGWNTDGTLTTPPTSVGGDKRFLTGNSVTGGFNNFWPADNTYWFNGAIQTTAPYAFYFFTVFTTPATTQNVQAEACGFIDPIPIPADPTDVDPCIYSFTASANLNTGFRLVNSNGGLQDDNINETNGGPRGWLAKQVAAGGFVAIPALDLSSGSTAIAYPQHMGASLVNQMDNPIPLEWGRTFQSVGTAGTPYGGKGVSGWLKFPSQQGFTGEYRDYSGIVGVNDGIIVNDCILPWPSLARLGMP